MIRVKATQRGYFGGIIREEGDEFEIKGKKQLGSWMQIVPAPEVIQPQVSPTQVPPMQEPPQVVSDGSENTPEEQGQTLGEVNKKVLDAQSDPDFLK